MISKRSRLMAIVLAVVTLLSVMTVGIFSSSAAAGDTVYCEDAAGWGSVYCYMWGDGTENQGWPGVQMTKGSDGLWSYSITGNWNMIIFNNGSDQVKTTDMSYPAGGNCYNNSNGGWTTVNGGNNNPTTPVDPQPTTPTPTPSGDNVVYFRNTANWSKVNVYMWNSDQDKNAEWPGAPAKSLGEGVWMYEASKQFKNVIFNDGSTQTGDLSYQGSDYIYDFGKSAWELYDTSKLHMKSFTADAESPQYTDVKINFTAVAGGGEGNLSYQFSVGSTVISEYSSSNKASWTPTTKGTYTVKVDVKDTLGNTVSKSLSFEIKDINSEVKPVIKNVEATPTNFEGTELEKGKEATVNVAAGGGNTGTKLLFYKYTITDPSGETANVPYYSLKNQYKFTPAKLGTYSITSTVQGSDNSITVKTVEYDSVDKFTAPGALSASLSVKNAGSDKYTATATAAGGVSPYTYEFKLNDKVVQAASAKATFTFDAAAEGNYKVEVIVKDAAGDIVTKSETIMVGGGDDPGMEPSDPVTTEPIEPGTTVPSAPGVEKLVASLAVEELGEGKFKFTASATGGEGDYQYQFAANTWTGEYSGKNTITIDMSKDGEYTIKVTVKDASGATATDEKVIKISGGVVDMPLEFNINYTETEISGQKCILVTVNAIGGEGDYQYECVVNGQIIPAYTSAGNVFAFGAPVNPNDTYELVVRVKDASGEPIEATGYVWTRDGELGYGAEMPETPDAPATPDEVPEDTNPTTKPSEPSGEYLKGDADLSGKVNVKDATLIQKHVAKLLEMNAQAQKNADVDGNGTLNIKDATNIQKFVANLIKW